MVRRSMHRGWSDRLMISSGESGSHIQVSGESGSHTQVSSESGSHIYPGQR